MPGVVRLEPDTRWSDLASGVGALVGQYFEKQKNKDASEKLQKIWDDPNINNTDKLFQVQSQLGDRGMGLLGKILDEQYRSGQVEQQGKVSKQADASTEQTIEKTKEDRLKAPAELARIQAETTDAQARALKTKADAELDPQRKKLLSAQVGETEANAAKLRGEADTSRMAHEMALNAANALKVGANPLKGFNVSDDVYAGLSDEVRASINAYITDLNPKGAIDTLKQTAMRDRPKAISDSTEKVVNSASTIANSAKDVVNGVIAAATNKDPTGGPSATVKAFLVEKGLIPGTPEFNTQLAAQHQLLVNSVQSGGGFGGQWKVRLGNQTIPNVLQGPAFQIVETNMILKDRMVELQREKQRFEGTETSTKSIDAAMAQIQPILDTTESLKGDKYGTLYFKGAAVNPKTLAPLPGREEQLDPEQVFDTKKGKVSGADLNDYAYRHNVKPSIALQALNASD